MAKGGYIGPGLYQNDIETDRRILRALGGDTSGALSGFTISPHGSLLRMVVAAGDAIVAAKTADVRRGAYFAWNETTEEVIFGAPSANPRIDAMILLFGDSQYGSLGSGVVNGPQWFVVPGTPNASPVAVTDGAIDTAVGSGSWVRWADVRIDPGNTTIQSGNITRFNPATRLGTSLLATVVFTSSGSFTKATYPRLRYIRVRAVGGGGAGGGAAATAAGESSGGVGGGSGAYGESVIMESALATSETVTIGAGGTAVSGGNGNTGGQTSFGAHVTAPGGPGGNVGAASSANNIGAASSTAAAGTGQTTSPGTAGQRSIRVSANQIGSGSGGDSLLGAGGRGQGDNSVTGTTATGKGGGGGGGVNLASQSARSGGAGAPGVVIVEVYG